MLITKNSSKAQTRVNDWKYEIMQHQNHLKAAISSFKRVTKPSTLIVARSALSLTLTQICSTQGISTSNSKESNLFWRASISEGDTLVHKYTACRRKIMARGKEDLHFQSRPLVHLRQECSWIGLVGLPVPARFIERSHGWLHAIPSFFIEKFA